MRKSLPFQLEMTIACATILFLSTAARAEPALFGAEFTFTNPALINAQVKYGSHIVNTPEAEAARDWMASIVGIKCPFDFRSKTVKNRYGVDTIRFTSKDGWWFQVATDAAVVEVQTKPASVAQLKKMLPLLEKCIFGSAAGAGLKPHRFVGSGHIHVGIQAAIGEDVVLFRNFLADMANHAELALGILGNDRAQGPALVLLSPEQQENFKAILAEFDQGKHQSVEALAKQVNERVYYQSTVFKASPEKNQAVCLNRIVDALFPKEEKTAEARFIRPQQSAEEFVLQAELFEKRLAWLKKGNGRIPFRPVDPSTLTDLEKARMFHAYVTESGLEWAKYSRWVPEALRNLPEFAQAPAPQATEECSQEACSLFGKILKWFR